MELDYGFKKENVSSDEYQRRLRLGYLPFIPTKSHKSYDKILSLFPFVALFLLIQNCPVKNAGSLINILFWFPLFVITISTIIIMISKFA